MGQIHGLSIRFDSSLGDDVTQELAGGDAEGAFCRVDYHAAFVQCLEALP